MLAQKSKLLKFKHTEYQPKKCLLHDWKKKKIGKLQRTKSDQKEGHKTREKKSYREPQNIRHGNQQNI